MKPRDRHKVFDAWLREHAAILHHVANGFAAGADRHDLMQELMLALWRAVPAFRGASRPSTFIFRVTHNAALTWKRTEKTHRRGLDAGQGIDAGVAPPVDDTGDDQAARLELLYAAIRELEPLDRSLVLLQLDGASYSQMAEIHGITESNVGVRLNRIRQKLTTLIEEKTS